VTAVQVARRFGVGWATVACTLWAATSLLACSDSERAQSGSVSSADGGEDAAVRSGDGVPPRGIDNPDNPTSQASDGDAGPAAPTTPVGPVDMGGCGDGKLQPGEGCDDGNNAPGDGCSVDCKIDRDFVCPTPGKACVSSVVCGDGRLAGGEACDDGNRNAGDGCDKNCKVEPGYQCQTPGDRCTAAKCGDNIVAGTEQCEDGDVPPVDGDGCSKDCKVESGYGCSKPGQHCHLTQCNDGVREGNEACDDGNQVLGDGCTPFCEVEPDCSAGACKSRCGDGLLLASDNEACDDGNTLDHDGCSAKCVIESGYECTLQQAQLDSVIAIPITYRDFNSAPTDGSTKHPDFEAFNGDAVTPGLVANMLGTDNKPVYTGICDDQGIPYPNPAPGTGPCPYNQMTTNRANFDQWYRDVSGVNVTKVAPMLLARDATTGLYANSNTDFFPWDLDNNSLVSQGKEQLLLGHDFGFTSEIHYYFAYQASAANPPTLTFAGDDDVWVFINRHLAVDLGGLHFLSTGSVTVDGTNAAQLGLESGKLYEVSLFHAERHTEQSNFNLTLAGFVSAKSQCQTRCGDGVKAGDELCDDGKNDGSYGSCTSDCKPAARCGDGTLQKDHEQCDDGVNLTTYSTTGKPGCAPGCQASAYCGDGRVDAVGGEQCDDGKDNQGGYGRCQADCQLGPRCGDRVVQGDQNENCDDGNLVNGDGCSRTCQLEQPQ
jgi:fibro-slime domain-containing protein